MVLSKAKHYKHLLPTGDCLNTSKLRGISLSIDPEISRERDRLTVEVAGHAVTVVTREKCC